MVSYLVRLATAPHEAPARNLLIPRALALLQLMIGQNGWIDVTVKLNYFAKVLELVSVGHASRWHLGLIRLSE
jgi:transformation/transcription domain-associated protein